MTNNTSNKEQPAWSPDGASIAFAVDNLGVGSNIFQVDLNGGNYEIYVMNLR